MKITIITVGKKHDKLLAGAIEDFEKRLKNPFKIEWNFLPNSNLSGEKAREEESSRLAKVISQDDYTILLDERGKNITSPQFSHLLTEKILSKNIKIIIGGAFGVSDDFRNSVDFVWSFSKLVFPHQIVRLVLVEQIYRAQEIAKNGKYHHE